MSGKEHRGLKCVVQQWQIDEYRREQRRQKMKPENLTKEQVEAADYEELLMWHTMMERQNQMAQIRKAMLNFIEIRDEQQGPRILHVDSKVVE